MSRALVLLAVLVALASAEVPEWIPCDESSDAVCTISEIRVDPCKEIRYCKFKKGKKAAIDIDFTTKWSGSDVKTGLFWASNSGDVPFAELNEADACQYTSCPLEADKKQTFQYSLYVNKKLPNGKFPLKWKMWKGDDESQLCCFKMNVELVRSRLKNN